MKDQVEYFAFVVSKHGIKPSPKKLEAIQKMEDPKSKKELQIWLGIVNYFRKFIPNMSTLSGPLTNLLAKDVPWNWTQECSEACTKVKELLV
jgi:putative transposase